MKRNRLIQFIFLVLYYGLARYLPPSHKNYLGRIGGRLRRFCCKYLFKYCASDSNIEHMAYFGTGENVELGSRSGIGIHCRIPRSCRIGDNVMMGLHCLVMNTGTHKCDRIDTPMIDQGRYDSGEVATIGDDVWIGRECLMLGGKKIGSHTIIGARSVISKDIPCYVIAVGNPIRVIKNRKEI